MSFKSDAQRKAVMAKLAKQFNRIPVNRQDMTRILIDPRTGKLVHQADLSNSFIDHVDMARSARFSPRTRRVLALIGFKSDILGRADSSDLGMYTVTRTRSKAFPWTGTGPNEKEKRFIRDLLLHIQRQKRKKQG